MDPLWKVRSGKFAGWRRGDRLYDADGKNVGYFSGDKAYSNRGSYIGQIYRDNWIGKRSTVATSVRSPRVSRVGIAKAKRADRAGLAIAGWEDPDF